MMELLLLVINERFVTLFMEDILDNVGKMDANLKQNISTLQSLWNTKKLHPIEELTRSRTRIDPAALNKWLKFAVSNLL